jgi:hypothetical protein
LHATVTVALNAPVIRTQKVNATVAAIKSGKYKNVRLFHGKYKNDRVEHWQ